MEQMAHLKKLGVDTTKASVVLIFKDEDGNEVDWCNVSFRDGEPIYLDEDDYGWPLSKNYLDAETGYYDHSFRENCGVFTVDDVLKMLPEYITCNGVKYGLTINHEPEDGYEISYYVWGTPILEFFAEDTLFEAAYNMLCWCAENGYLNKE